jgi:son of sevenless-like protein
LLQDKVPLVYHENGWDWGNIRETDPKSAKTLFETLMQIMEPFSMKVMKLMRNTKAQANVGKHANRSMALFLRDLLPILNRDYTIQLIQKYLNSMMATDASIVLLKVECCTILMDYDHFVSINIGAHGPVIAHLCMEVIYDVLSIKKQATAEKGISQLLAHLVKIDYDARHDEERFPDRRERVAELYLPFVEKVLLSGDMLHFFVNDKFHVDLVTCMLWILSNMAKSKLVEWWHKQDKAVIYRTCKFLELAASALYIQPDHELCREGQLVIKEIVALFIAPTTMIPIIENLRVITVRSPDEQQPLDVSNSFEDELESNLVPHPYVTLLMRFLSHMLMNLIVSSDIHATTNNLTGQLHLRLYFQILETFLENYMDELTLKCMYRGDTKIPLLHQKKVEVKWRWLLGVVSLNSELKADSMSKPLRKCISLLIEPYLNDAEYLRHNQELNENEMEGDIIYDEKEHTIRGATLKKLIERLIQHSDFKDTEGNKFKKTFLLTYFSFTTPRDLLAQLVKLYNLREGDSAAQLNALNFIQEWIKKGFHDFDNFAISEMIQFLSALDVNPITRNKMRKPIMRQLLGVLTQHTVTAQHAYDPSEVPKDFDLEEMEVPVMPIKKWKQLKKKMNVNPFDYPFDILQWSSLEIAKQMAIIESELFNAVEPKECFGLAWSKENKEDLAPNLVALSNRFQQVTLWIANMILGERDMKKRQSVLIKWIEIMRESYHLKNFAGVYQISAALNSAEIGRLTRTKEAIDSKDLEFCEHTLGFSQTNYKILRGLIKESAGSPTIPFIGVYLTDLTFTNDGNVDNLAHSTVTNRALINFTKRRLYSTSISDIQLLQQSCKFPKFRPIPFLQYILRDHINTGITFATERERYNQSLELEPRQQK